MWHFTALLPHSRLPDRQIPPAQLTDIWLHQCKTYPFTTAWNQLRTWWMLMVVGVGRTLTTGCLPPFMLSVPSQQRFIKYVIYLSIMISYRMHNLLQCPLVIQGSGWVSSVPIPEHLSPVSTVGAGNWWSWGTSATVVGPRNATGDIAGVRHKLEIRRKLLL